MSRGWTYSKMSTVEEVIWGTRDFQVPKFFNFADVIDEWAQKEKVFILK